MIIEKKEEFLKRELPLFISSKTGDFIIVSEYFEDLNTAYIKKLHCPNFSDIFSIIKDNKEHEYFIQSERVTLEEMDDEYVVFDNKDLENIIIPIAEIIESNLAQQKKEYMLKKEEWERENKDKKPNDDVEDISFKMKD